MYNKRARVASGDASGVSSGSLQTQNQIGYIIRNPSMGLQNSQALSDLPNGYLYNNRGRLEAEPVTDPGTGNDVKIKEIPFVLTKRVNGLDNAQVLDELPSGFLYNNKGILEVLSIPTDIQTWLATYSNFLFLNRTAVVVPPAVRPSQGISGTITLLTDISTDGNIIKMTVIVGGCNVTANGGSVAPGNIQSWGFNLAPGINPPVGWNLYTYVLSVDCGDNDCFATAVNIGPAAWQGAKYLNSGSSALTGTNDSSMVILFEFSKI